MSNSAGSLFVFLPVVDMVVTSLGRTSVIAASTEAPTNSHRVVCAQVPLDCDLSGVRPMYMLTHWLAGDTESVAAGSLRKSSAYFLPAKSISSRDLLPSSFLFDTVASLASLWFSAIK